jgi:adenylate kinase family enzyme
VDGGLGRRISVVGNTGSGKSTLAAGLARALGLHYIELDGIFHQPGWASLSSGAFRHRVRQALGHGDWVVDGNYSPILRDVVWPRADTVVWLDYPLSVVAPRIIGRTARRALRHEPICNGNFETWPNLWQREGIVRWALGRHRVYRARYGAAAQDPAWAHLAFVRLRSPAQADAMLAAAAAGARVRS